MAENESGACVSQTPDFLCTSQGWPHDPASAKCSIPITSAGTDYDGCFTSGQNDPQCSDVFGESLAFPASLSGVALTLYNAFDSRTSNSNADVATAMRIYRDAVAARHNGDPNYLSGPLGNLDDNGPVTNIYIGQWTRQAFAVVGIAFDEDSGNLPNEIRTAFAAVPVRAPFVFNCGPGATPATANTISATQCQCADPNPYLHNGACRAQCPAQTIPLNGECVPPTPANKCRAANWETSQNLCNISVANFQSNASTMTAALRFNQCALAQNENLPECSVVFGPELKFPVKPAAPVTYPFNCDADQSRGLIPATANTIGITGECQCADTAAIRKGARSLNSGGGYAPMVGGRCEPCAADEFVNGDECVKTCPTGKVTLGRKCVTPGEKCAARGWEHVGFSGSCLIRNVLIGNVLAEFNDLCRYASTCADAFGPNLDFPQKPADGSSPRYIYNCDPDGTRGLIPATANTIVATGQCECANPERTRQGATRSTSSEGNYTPLVGGQCVCPAGKIDSADGLSCVCPADKVAEGSKCVCPAGTTDVSGYCATPAQQTAAQQCVAAGWTFADGACAIPTSTGGTISASCQIGNTDEGRVGEVSCADAFAPKGGEGDEGGLNFPMKPMSLFAVAAYVYDCAGGATPSGANENGETTCQCPAGMVYVDGECVEGTLANKCKAKGWRVTVQFGSLNLCKVGSANGLVSDTFLGSRFAEDCLLTENPRPGDEGCHLQFGSEVDFPQRPADGSSPFHAFNCGTAHGGVPVENGLIPASAPNGATDCYCEDADAKHFGAMTIDNGAGVTLRYGGVCLSGESARAAAACEGAGWSLTSDSKGWQCAIPVMRGTLSTGSSEGCYLSGVATVALPQCSEVFGGSFAFPEKPTGTAPRYVFDCGTKMTPEGANLDGATTCECAATNAQGQCICGGGRVERPNPEGGTHCVCIRGTAEVGGICVNREGPIGGVSEGLAAQVTLCTAFGGEVLRGEGVEAVEGSFTATNAKSQALLESLRTLTPANAQAALDIQVAIDLYTGWLNNDADYKDGVVFNSALALVFYSGILSASGWTQDEGNNCILGAAAEAGVDCVLALSPKGATVVEGVEAMEGDAYGCRGVDKSGTFCLLGSLEVFPCRGLFTRARDCNIKYNRPLLNPFLCAPRCRVTTTSRGPTCE